MNAMTLFPAAWQEVARRIFAAWGASEESATVVARSLVESELAGVSGHGLIRISDYINHAKNGWVVPSGRPSITRETATTTLVDGGYGFGQPAAYCALDATIPKARSQGIAAASVVHCGHVGRIGEYAEKAAAEKMVALVTASGGGNMGLVVPFGGAERVFSTNPIAAGVPAGTHDPFIMDFATSVVAAGKLELAPDKDKPIPRDWALKADGSPAATRARVPGRRRAPSLRRAQGIRPHAVHRAPLQRHDRGGGAGRRKSRCRSRAMPATRRSSSSSTSPTSPIPLTSPRTLIPSSPALEGVTPGARVFRRGDSRRARAGAAEGKRGKSAHRGRRHLGAHPHRGGRTEGPARTALPAGQAGGEHLAPLPLGAQGAAGAHRRGTLRARRAPAVRAPPHRRVSASASSRSAVPWTSWCSTG